jgi:hypothetical protein
MDAATPAQDVGVPRVQSNNGWDRGPVLAAAAELRRLEARLERVRQKLRRALGHSTRGSDSTVFKQADYISRLVVERRELALKILQLELLA